MTAPVKASNHLPGGEIKMGKLGKIINNVPPDGFRWQVLDGGKVLKSGTAKSREDANKEADKAIEQLGKR